MHAIQKSIERYVKRHLDLSRLNRSFIIESYPMELLLAKAELLLAQARLFIPELTESQINLIRHHHLIVYSDVFEPSDTTYELNQITWKYDDHNYRIPYVNGIKLNQISLPSDSNLYDFISSSSLLNDEDLICGEKFVGICDVFAGHPDSIRANPNTHRIQKNTTSLEDIESLSKHDTIFIKTDDLLHFYQKCSNIDKTIVTHNSDREIDSRYIPYLNKVKQYSQNCVINHPNLIPIPIGIENTQWFDHELLHRIRKTKIKKEKEIYFMFSLHTHVSRSECYEKLKHKLPWNRPLSKEDYFVELKKHKYAICPRGNGLDTHRLWECFYLDVIPIMLKRDSVHIEHLPIVWLNDWDELNTLPPREFKEVEFSRITFDHYRKKINP